MSSEEWRPVGVVVEGQSLVVAGVSVWDPVWRSEHRSIDLAHPQYPSQRHRAGVYALPDADNPVRLAIAEVSAGVYAVAVCPPTAEVTR